MKRLAIVLLLAALSACERRGRQQEGTESSSDPARLRSAELVTDGPKGVAAADKKGFVQNIEKLTEDNRDFRRVLYTGAHSQLVVMALPPGEHIGAEVHPVDQFFRVEEGAGEVVIGEKRTPITSGSAIVIPAGAKHDIINTGTSPLRVYTLYSPPQHRDRVVHPTRADAERDKEHFDGKTTE